MIVEGKIVNHDSETYGQVKIGADGLIEAVSENLGTADLKTTGLIFPGFVDVHVHAREDASGSQNYKEDFRTMSEAAIHGGVVAVCDMSNNPIPPVDAVSYQKKQSLAKNSLVDVVLYAGIGPGTRPLTVKVPYKVYMGKSVGEMFFESFSELEETMKLYSDQDVSFHCEDPEILKARENELEHAARRPREAEKSAVEFAIMLAGKFNLRAKICHIVTRESLEAVSRAKSAGLPVTAEVTPHHLYFEDSAFLVNPPLRTKADREALIAGLKSGIIDCLATDHAPHTIEEKQGGVSGVPHLDTYGAFSCWLMVEHGFTPQDIARVSSFNPGNFINRFIEQKFGRIEAGFAGSLSIIDPSSPTTIRREDLKTKCAWSPFEGITFPGRVTHTVVRGIVYEN